MPVASPNDRRLAEDETTVIELFKNADGGCIIIVEIIDKHKLNPFIFNK